MLDISRLHEQFSEFSTYQVQEYQRYAAMLKEALAVLRVINENWDKSNKYVVSARSGSLIAQMQEAPATAHAGENRPTPVTVVATDGSQIYPDRHFEPTCYLLNISRIAFQYGTQERPLMEALPQFGYRSADLQECLDEYLEVATADVVSAIRDECELRALLDVAKQTRVAGRPIVAVSDGTLIRWMLRGMRNRALEQNLIARYTEILKGFRDEHVPLCSYISMPGNTEVINLISAFHKANGSKTASENVFAGIVDRKIFEQILEPGERSAIFESASHIQREYDREDRICYFYLRVISRSGSSEIGRVEFPQWVAEDSRFVNLVHSVVLSECEKGDGYPMILSEAHEQAVIRARERELFYQLVERKMMDSGIVYEGSRKAASKRRPIV